jgi:hypothetical protein
MVSVTEGILSGDSIRTAYVLVTMLLSALVLFAMWRGRETVGKHVVVPLYTVIPTFAASRLLIAAGGPLEFGTVDFTLFTLLNFVGCALMATSLLAVAVNELPGGSQSRLFPLSVDKLRKQMLYFGLFGLSLYLLRSPGETPAECRHLPPEGHLHRVWRSQVQSSRINHAVQRLMVGPANWTATLRIDDGDG